MKTAQVLIIGNEILSGRTLDTNTQFLAKSLGSRGVRVIRCFTISDDMGEIVSTIQNHHQNSDYFFVCGGIGSTPDDKTRGAVAQAMGVSLMRHPVADKLLREYYGARLNDDRISMADLPQGCTLIDNPITAAPGFKIKNLYVFAGIPKLVQAMFENVRHEFTGIALHEREITLNRGEGELSTFMRTITDKYPLVELGSYPLLDPAQLSLPFEKRQFGTQIVLRGEDSQLVDQAFEEFMAMVSERFSSSSFH